MSTIALAEPLAHDPAAEAAARQHTFCGRGALIGYDAQTATFRVVPMTCHRWDCPRCGPHKKALWRRIIIAGRPTRWFTLTVPHGDFATPEAARLRMNAAWNKLAQLIRKKCGVFEYVKVWEKHLDGYPHLHVIYRGKYCHWKWLKACWKNLTGGSNIFIEELGNAGKVAAYTAKYLSKDCSLSEVGSTRYRVITKSRHWLLEQEEPSDADPRPSYSWTRSKLDPCMVLDKMARRGYLILAYEDHSGAVLLRHKDDLHGPRKARDLTFIQGTFDPGQF
jgi:hypothetical protein